MLVVDPSWLNVNVTSDMGFELVLVTMPDIVIFIRIAKKSPITLLVILLNVLLAGENVYPALEGVTVVFVP